jgi:hypothetical protein
MQRRIVASEAMVEQKYFTKACPPNIDLPTFEEPKKWEKVPSMSYSERS